MVSPRCIESRKRRRCYRLVGPGSNIVDFCSRQPTVAVDGRSEKDRPFALGGTAHRVRVNKPRQCRGQYAATCSGGLLRAGPQSPPSRAASQFQPGKRIDAQEFSWVIGTQHMPRRGRWNTRERIGTRKRNETRRTGGATPALDAHHVARRDRRSCADRMGSGCPH